MNLEQLIAAARQRCDDNVTPPQVSDDQFTLWADEAEKEACERAHLLYDTSCRELRINIAADKAIYKVDPIVLLIDAAAFTPSGSALARDIDVVGIDAIRCESRWQNRRGVPTKVAHIDKARLMVWPAPTGAGVLQLSAYRYPTDSIAVNGSPEIPVEHHDGMVYWMAYRFFEGADAETRDPARAGQEYALFEDLFGDRKSADVMRRHRERRSHTSSYGGY